MEEWILYLIDRQYQYMIEQDWNQRRAIIISILQDTITLLEEMSSSFRHDYHPKRITNFRLLCYGYLVISKNNIKTSLLLIENGLLYQIHPISRSIFEIVVNLNYIDADDSERNERTKRFFDYQYVDRYNVLHTMESISEIPQDVRTKEQDDKIQHDYSEYLKRYNMQKRERGITNWSGFNLVEMIQRIPDDNRRNDLLKGYKLVPKIDNQYIHPSIEYLKNIVRDEYHDNLDRDLSEVRLLESIYLSTSKIIEIYLKHFQKNRMVFQRRADEIERRFSERTFQ